MSNDLSKSVATLVASQKELQDLLDKERRCRDAICSAATHSEKIAEVQFKRDEVSGGAFLKGIAPDLSLLDKEISGLQHQSQEVQKTGQAAESALRILGPQIESAKAAVASAHERHNEVVAETVRQVFSDAETAYHSAVGDIKGALARMSAAANLLRDLTGAGPTAQVAFIIGALSGRHAGGVVPNGLVVKTGPHDQYEPDMALWVGGLGAEASAALDEMRGVLLGQGALL